jgi:hypothetical protein
MYSFCGSKFSPLGPASPRVGDSSCNPVAAVASALPLSSLTLSLPELVAGPTWAVGNDDGGGDLRAGSVTMRRSQA